MGLSENLQRGWGWDGNRNLWVWQGANKTTEILISVVSIKTKGQEPDWKGSSEHQLSGNTHSRGSSSWQPVNETKERRTPSPPTSSVPLLTFPRPTVLVTCGNENPPPASHYLKANNSLSQLKAWSNPLPKKETAGPKWSHLPHGEQTEIQMQLQPLSRT